MIFNPRYANEVDKLRLTFVVLYVIFGGSVYLVGYKMAFV